MRKLRTARPERIWRLERQRQSGEDFGLGAPIDGGQAKARPSWVVPLVLSYSRKGTAKRSPDRTPRRSFMVWKMGCAALAVRRCPDQTCRSKPKRKNPKRFGGTESPASFSKTLKKAENHLSALSGKVHGTCCCLLEIISRPHALPRCSDFCLARFASTDAPVRTAQRYR